MLAKTHMIFGTAAIAAAGSMGIISFNPITVSAGLVGSLLPDIDHPTSTFGRKIWPVSWLIGKIFGHRGITHSAIASVLIFAVLGWGAASIPDWVTALALGYLSHLLADWFNPAGVPFFWPNKKKFCSPITCKTGGIGELAASGAALFLSLILIFQDK